VIRVDANVPPPPPRVAEFPLLDWLVGELRGATGLDDRRARHRARQLLTEAFASVDRVATQSNRKEISR
jgi:hypothetical protein